MEILRVITFGAMVIAIFLCILYWIHKLATCCKHKPEIIHVPALPEYTSPTIHRCIGFVPITPKEILNDAMKELERIDADETHISMAHGNGEKIITIDLNINRVKK